MKKALQILAHVCHVVIYTTGCSGAALAAQQQITLTSDQSQIVNLPDEPATVVVGNPSIADVTIEGKMLFFHPRGSGVTSIIVLDAAGRRLGDYSVHIIYGDSYGVAMYGPAGRQSYSCRRDCEPVMRIGDDPVFFGNYSDQARSKNALAATQALGEELLVPHQNAYTLPSLPSY
jgi:hypothetical protein